MLFREVAPPPRVQTPIATGKLRLTGRCCARRFGGTREVDEVTAIDQHANFRTVLGIRCVDA
jgi:hypothetical protein